MPDPLLWALVPIIGFIGVALARWTAAAVAHAVIEEIRERLEVDELRADVATIKSEVTLNGGGSLKDMALEMHRQMEALLTDGR